MAKSSTIDMRDMRCGCCGRTDGDLLIDQPFEGPATILCAFCRGLIDANLIRVEVVDAVLRYRQWRIAWTPGDLIPLPKTPSA